jgi:hypothetical protein
MDLFLCVVCVLWLSTKQDQPKIKEKIARNFVGMSQYKIQSVGTIPCVGEVVGTCVGEVVGTCVGEMVGAGVGTKYLVSSNIPV